MWDTLSRSTFGGERRVGSNGGMSKDAARAVELVELAKLGEQLGTLRLQSPEDVQGMQRSLLRHGQMTAATAYRVAPGQLQLLDGFKRLQAARGLGWATLQVRVLDVAGAHAKAAVEALNQQGGLTELEEGWLVRSLHREDGLTQPEIGQLLGRHKSWVCRRLMLVELLDEVVQGDVRLGLLAARTATSLARLPRGNQRAAAEVVAQRGLTTKQTEQLCAALLATADEAERSHLLDDWASGRAGPSNATRTSPRDSQSPALLIALDVGQLCRLAARLEARLLERPLASFGPEAAATVRSALEGLRPVLALLLRATERSSSSTTTTTTPRSLESPS